MEFLNTAFYYLFISILGVLAIGIVIGVLFMAFPFVVIIGIILSLMSGQFFLAFILGIVFYVWLVEFVKKKPGKYDKYPFK